MKEVSFEKLVNIIKTKTKPTEHEMYDQNLKAFEGLEDWVIKNVSEDRRANLVRLKMLKSDLMGWQTILIKLKGKPLHDVQQLEEKRQAFITRFEAIIEAALKDLDFRIDRKEKINEQTGDVKLITIDPDYLQTLQSEFVSFISEDEKAKANQLLEGKKISGKVKFNGSALSAVKCFTYGYHHKKIKISNNDLALWISNNINCEKKNQPHEIPLKTAIEYLRPSYIEIRKNK